MRTRLLMRVSAIVMAALGIRALFMPQEILIHYGARPDTSVVLLLQAAGALYLGFAMLNWTAQGALIGGIYNRPVAARLSSAVSKLRLKPPSDGPQGRDGEASLLGGRSAAAAETASNAE